MKNAFLTLLALTLASACQSSPPEAVQTTEAAAPPASAHPEKRLFGSPLRAAPTKNLAAVLNDPQRYADDPIIVEGYVRRACSKKGCWMELSASEAPGAPACRVTFKDYGFFVPTNSAGSTARLEGVVTLRRVDKKLVAHLEEEGATFAGKAEDGTADEVRILATGVELTRPKT
jgi:hypothetical protein